MGTENKYIDMNNELEKINKCKRIIALEGQSRYVTLEESINMPDPGSAYVTITVPPKFLTSAGSKKTRDARMTLFKRYRVVLISWSIVDMESKTLDSVAAILVTGRSNPRHKDNDTLVLNLPDRIATEVKLADMSPENRIDRAFKIDAPDQNYDYITLEEMAAYIGVGYKPPKIPMRAGGYSMEVLSPENINELGELVGEPQTYTSTKLPQTKPLEAGDVIIASFGGNSNKGALGRIGYGAVIDRRFANGRCYAHHFLIKVRLKEEYDPYYLVFALGEEYVRKQLWQIVKPTGGSQFLITKNEVSMLNIRKLDNMSEISRQYRDALNERRSGYERIKKLRG